MKYFLLLCCFVISQLANATSLRGTTGTRMDFGVFYPMQNYTIQTDKSNEKGFTLAGLGGYLAADVIDDFAIMASFESNFNALNGGRIFSGFFVGGRYFIFGDNGYGAADASTSLEVRRVYRLYTFGGLGQKAFDFRSFYTREENLTRAGQDQGDFWASEGGLGLDYLTQNGLRWGLFVKYYKSLNTSKSDVKITSLEYCLSLDLFELL